MKIETFEDVLASISKNKDRNFHLLLGNGFSMAYDHEIFSYNALHEFISKIEDSDLNRILKVIETKNFELIMQQLDITSALIKSFNPESPLADRIQSASDKLKSSLLDAVRSLHPEHVFTVPEEKSERCSKFLKIFLDTNGSIFSTNYDLLLYWILMRNEIVNHNDGFGREPDDSNSFPDEQTWSDLIWGVNKEEQNVYYLHGALPLFDSGVEIIKEVYDTNNYLLEKISNRMDKAEYPIFVTAGDGREKLSHIMHNHYLSHCYESLCETTGSIVTFGFNFGPYDDHIINAINRAAKHGSNQFPKLNSIYIGAYTKEDAEHIEKIKGKFKCKVRVFDSKTAPVWNKT